MPYSEDERALKAWNNYLNSALSDVKAEPNETYSQKRQRMDRLVANFERWAEYYFPHYYTCKPAPFHVAASKRVIENPEFVEVRMWSRDLAKSVRSMMEILYLALQKKKRNVLFVSFSQENAARLLSAIKEELETNERIASDYGVQQNLGNWEKTEFITRGGVAFRALGKGQNPRGHRYKNYRADAIVVDDIDSDEELKNPDRVRASIEWVERALLATRSTGEKDPLLVIVNGNLIDEKSIVAALARRADHKETIGIVDSNGAPVWPDKVSLNMVARLRSKMSAAAFAQEYMNVYNREGNTFKSLNWGPVPKIAACDAVIVYCDPATSNREVSGGSMKAVVIVGLKDEKYYILNLWVDNMKNSTFISLLFEASEICVNGGCDVFSIYIENNSLQAPFYDQVLLPLVRKEEGNRCLTLPLFSDKRKKAEKYTRIEATLEPLNRAKKLIFNEELRDDANMQRAADQMLAVSPRSKFMDAPDAIEGAVWLLNKKVISLPQESIVYSPSNRRF